MLVTTAALVLAACGSDDDAGGSTAGLSDADRELAAAITADLLADDEDGFADSFDTECMGVETVRALGGAAAIESKYGITVANVDQTDETPLDETDAEKVADGYAKCGDFTELFVQGFVADGTATQEQAECLLADVSDDLIKGSIVESFRNIEEGEASGQLFAAIFGRVEECGIEF